MQPLFVFLLCELVLFAVFTLAACQTCPQTVLLSSFSPASSSSRNMIKSFYTASLLMDVLSVFGELSEEVRSAVGEGSDQHISD